MAIEVFNRYEEKYVINTKTFMLLKEVLSEYMEPDAHNRRNQTYSITNIYYDTDDNQLIRSSLEKPSYKEKLRLRAYGTPDLDSRVYIEIKKKYKGLVNKRRSGIKLSEAYQFVETGILPEIMPYMNGQVLAEIGYMLERYRLVPKVYLSYERMAFFSTGQHDLRISFDTNIQTRRTDLKLESGIYGEQLLESDNWVMEIKSSESMPFWLARLLAEHKIYPVSFSKYGTEYEHLIMEKEHHEFGTCTLEAPQLELQTLISA